MTESGPYRVQVFDGAWTDCVREDLIDEFGGETAKLPKATFATIEAATQFITTLRGLMHMGGTDTRFHVVDEEGDTVLRDYYEHGKRITKAPESVEPFSEWDAEILSLAGLVSRIMTLDARQPLVAFVNRRDDSTSVSLTLPEAFAMAAILYAEDTATTLIDELPGAGRGY